MTDPILRRAEAGDVGGVTATVCSAYLPYIERIGRQPGPMLEDYASIVRDGQVYVVVEAGTVVGVIVMSITEEGFYVENVAVRPTVKGSGVGRRLLEFAEAEARRQGFTSLYLATHLLMTENQVLYRRIGYVPFDERVINGFPRVFMRKILP